MSASNHPGLRFAKTQSSLDKLDRQAKRDTADKDAKDEVRARDKRTCRVTGLRADHVHEALLFKSRGGKASLYNSICVTALVHTLMQRHLIEPIVLEPAKGCSGRLKFEMTARTAAKVFGRRPIPSHVVMLGMVARRPGSGKHRSRPASADAPLSQSPNQPGASE